MKQVFKLIFCLGYSLSATAQPVFNNNFPTKNLNSQVVTLYENENFSGRSKELGIGEYRLDAFNDMASSIKIPSGFAVFLFESFDDEGGYGGWADWSADIDNLDKVALNNKVSYIRVFNAEREGQIWMPASMSGNVVISGHWERKRVNPAPLGNPLAGQIIYRNLFQPHSEDADVGYGPLPINLGDYTPWWMRDSWVNFDANDVKIVDAKTDINLICPQHRSVGEQSALAVPKQTYAALEGTVTSSGISYMDFPSSHYTHDFDFTVVPDPAYHYLFGDYITGPGLNGVGWKRADSQTEIEVEWESGLGQDNVIDGVANPATAANRYGNSFGFFSAGHTSKDELWNWPADGDHIHVEGLWIWERAHQPVHTEIHPAHFVAVQRKDPVSFIIDGNNQPVVRNQADDKYLATRVDVFASGDGNPMLNTKGLNAGFNQLTSMNRKDYSFVIKHPYSNVVTTSTLMHTGALQCRYVKQKGDNFPAGADPVIEVIPGNAVRVTIPWKSRGVANTAVFARTFLVYWAEVSNAVLPATTKVLETEKPKLYKVELLKLNLTYMKDNKNVDGEVGDKQEYGNFRIYTTVGNTWIFLNEFTGGGDGSNILSTGLGNAKNIHSFNVSKSFNVYLALDKSRSNYADKFYNHLQIKAQGYEADAIDIMMGHIINEYSRDKEVVNKFFGEHLKYLNDHGGADDEIGKINTLLSHPYDINWFNGQGLSTGVQTLPAYENHDGKAPIHVFDVVVKITEIPFAVATSGGGVLMAPVTH